MDTSFMINLGILTSSRADFGIYEPLLRNLLNEKDINPQIIAFGTHLSERYGFSIEQVEKASIPIIARFDTTPNDDSPSGIVGSMAATMQSMIKIWQQYSFDLVIALGDRYEMFAAVASTLPFNIKVAHIHGGETTLGAIDNALRHSITHMSALHFASSETYRERIIELTGSEAGVYNTGALSVENLNAMSFMSKNDILKSYGIDLNLPTMLITLHPETIGFEKNELYIKELIKALEEKKDLQQIITMPNADTSGLIIRRYFEQYSTGKSNVRLVENFGSVAYLSVMSYASMVLGNSSSGVIEAAFFPKWVINIGDRQKGRLRTSNILDVPFNSNLIREAIETALSEQVPDVPPIYGNGNTSEKIIKIILNECNSD